MISKMCTQKKNCIALTMLTMLAISIDLSSVAVLLLL